MSLNVKMSALCTLPFFQNVMCLSEIRVDPDQLASIKATLYTFFTSHFETCVVLDCIDS